MFRQEWINRYTRTIERLLIEDRLLETDYYRMYTDALEKEDLEYVVGINLNSQHGDLIRDYMRQLDKWLKG